MYLITTSLKRRQSVLRMQYHLDLITVSWWTWVHFFR